MQNPNASSLLTLTPPPVEVPQPWGAFVSRRGSAPVGAPDEAMAAESELRSLHAYRQRSELDLGAAEQSVRTCKSAKRSIDRQLRQASTILRGIRTLTTSTVWLMADQPGGAVHAAAAREIFRDAHRALDQMQEARTAALRSVGDADRGERLVDAALDLICQHETLAELAATRCRAYCERAVPGKTDDQEGQTEQAQEAARAARLSVTAELAKASRAKDQSTAGIARAVRAAESAASAEASAALNAKMVAALAERARVEKRAAKSRTTSVDTNNPLEDFEDELLDRSIHALISAPT